MLPVPYSSILFWCGMGPSRGPALGSLGSGALTPKHRALKQNRHSAPEPQRGLCIVPAIFWTIITNKNRNHIKIYMRISFKMNRTNKKKVPHKIETAFNFTKDIDLKINRRKEIEYWEFSFNSIYEIPLKMIRTKKKFTTNLKSPSILKKKSI